MTDNKVIMAENLKRLMKDKGVNATDVCNALNFKHNTFSDWINAKRYPRVDKINKMAAYFNVDNYELTEPYSKIDKLTKYREELKLYEERLREHNEKFKEYQTNEIQAAFDKLLKDREDFYKESQEIITELQKMDKKKKDHLLAYMRLLNNES